MMKHKPQRMCVACRNMINQDELLRVIKNNETGEIELDLDKKKFGRGAYVCKNEKCINLAKKKKAFERNMKVGSAESIYDLLMQCWGE